MRIVIIETGIKANPYEMQLLTMCGEHNFQLEQAAMDNLIEQVMPFAMRRQVTDQMAEDIAISAIEGGVYGIGGWVSSYQGHYWIQCRNMHDDGNEKCPLNKPDSTDEDICECVSCFKADGELRLTLSDDDTTRTLNKEQLKNGIALAAQRAGKTIEAWMDNHDAQCADNAFQYALFGEVLYG